MFSKILTFALIVLFAVGAEAQPLPGVPVSDSAFANDYEEFVGDITDEPTVEIPGALCFHEESLPVSDREMLEKYAKKTGSLRFLGVCLEGESSYGEYLPISVPESFLYIPGTYVFAGNDAGDPVLIGITALVVGIVVVSFVGIFRSKR